jgi:hypothetical protein
MMSKHAHWVLEMSYFDEIAEQACVSVWVCSPSTLPFNKHCLACGVWDVKATQCWEACCGLLMLCLC